MTAYAEPERRTGPSLLANIGGVCTAFGVLLVFAAVAAAIATWVGVDADMSENRWRQAGWVVAGGSALTLLVGFLLGGYMAGRSATTEPDRRTAGIGNGFMVFVLAAAVMAAAAVVTAAFVDIDLRANAEAAGIPTFADPWTTIGTVAAVATGLAMLFGSLIGGMLGARHAPTVVLRRQVVREDRTEAIDLRDVGEDGDGDADRTERLVTHADGTMTTEPEHDHSRN